MKNAPPFDGSDDIPEGERPGDVHLEPESVHGWGLAADI